MLALVPAELEGQLAIQTSWCQAIRRKSCYIRAARNKLISLCWRAGRIRLCRDNQAWRVYKVLAHAHCPVITLSPVVLAECGSKAEKLMQAEAYMAGVI